MNRKKHEKKDRQNKILEDRKNRKEKKRYREIKTIK